MFSTQIEQGIIKSTSCLLRNKYTYTYAGNINVQEGEERWSVKQFIHPEYKEDDEKTWSSDYGLIKLNSKFSKLVDKGRYLINPICLPAKQEAKNEHDENATIYGFGVENGKDVKQILRADIVLQPYYLCDKGMICAFYDDKDPRACMVII